MSGSLSLRWLLRLAGVACLAATTAAALPAAAADTAPSSTRLQALGTRLTLGRPALGVVEVREAPAASAKSATSARQALPLRSFPLDPSLPHAVSADGRVIAGISQAKPDRAPELTLYDLASGERKGAVALPGDAPPDGLWIDGSGTAAGVWVRDRFVAFAFDGKAATPPVVFDHSAAGLWASPSGRLVLLLSESGHLVLLDTRIWRELPQAERAIEQGLQTWLQKNGFRRSQASADGPFTFPVVPLALSADDRLISITLGENANTFVNLCMANGALASAVVLDKRVNAKATFSQTGRLFAVQVTPNTTDPAFQRPRSDFGLRIYASHSGKLLQTLPIASADWARAAKPGAAYFLDAFPGWVGFLPADKAVLRIDSVSGQPMAQALKLAALAADPQDKAAASCPVLLAP